MWKLTRRLHTCFWTSIIFSNNDFIVSLFKLLSNSKIKLINDDVIKNLINFCLIVVF